MTGSDRRQFGASGIFKGLYLCAAAIFILLMAYRIALLFDSKPDIIPVLVLFLALAALFVLLSKILGRKDQGAGLNFRMLAVGFLCTYSLTLYMPAERSLIWLLIFALGLFFVRFALKKESSYTVRVASLLLGLLFALFIFLGYQLEGFERLEILYVLDEPVTLLRMVFCLAGQALMFAIALNTVFAGIVESDFSTSAKDKPSAKRTVLTVALMTAGIFICYLPYYYAFYPANLSPDSIFELEMQLGLKPLSNHHPVVHQLLIGLSLWLGGSSLELGVGIYSVIQMLVLAISFAGCVYFLGRMGANKYIQGAAFCFFALFSVNGFYSVTMWKDVLYAAVSLGFMMLLICEAKNETVGKTRLWLGVTVVLAGFLFCVFRNNGWYAFLLGFPLYIICNRKNWKRLCAQFLIVVLLVSGYNHIIFDVMGIKKSASGEALSVPLQQIARTVSKNPEDLGDEEFTVLREVFCDLEGLGERYKPYISDPVKAGDSFLADVFDENPMRYLKSWAKIGLKHPVTYVEAFLLQCYGYWYPDVSYWIIHNDIEANELGLEMKPERNGTRFEMSMLTRDISQELPTAILYSLGLMVWLMMIAAALLMLKGQGKIASPIFILAGLWLTTLASPVYCEYRYMYGFVVCVPLFLGLALGLRNRTREQGQEN